VITPTRWGHGWKILPRTPPEILRRIFLCNKNFWENFFQHPIKPEVGRKWRHRTLRSAIFIIRNTYELRFEFLCDSYCCYKGYVSKLTEKSSSIDSNKSATVNVKSLRNFDIRKILVHLTCFSNSSTIKLISTIKFTLCEWHTVEIHDWSSSSLTKLIS